MAESDRNSNQASHYLDAIIDRFEDTLAIVVTADGQTLRWPIKNLPENCQKGQAVRLVMSSAESEQAEREILAKTILNQILKKSD